MLPRREVPTACWQAIVAHTLVVLQQGEDVTWMSHLCDSSVAGLTVRRQRIGKLMRIHPFRWARFICASVPVDARPRAELKPLTSCHSRISARFFFWYLECRKWGCNKWGLKGCLAYCPGNRPKSAFFTLFLPFSAFSGGPGQHLENPENGGKGPFSSDILGFA